MKIINKEDEKSTIKHICTCICLGNALRAQNTRKAKALLDEVYNKVKSYDNISVDFKFDLK